jgi:uncharacterized iron-regulated membrane protein
MPNPYACLLSRGVWLKIHLYLALSFGVLFVILSLSGAAMLFGNALDEWLNPQLSVTPGAAPLPPDRLMAAVRAVHPDRHGEWVLESPRTPDAAATAWYERPHETVGESYAPLMVSINPYTGEILASRFWGHTAASWLYKLHTQLLLGRTGALLAGFAGLALLFSILSGLYLWGSGLSGPMRGWFKLRTDLGLRRFALNAHRLLGLIAAAALVVLSFTGVNLVWPDALESLLGASGMGHGEVAADVRSTAVPNDRPVSLLEATAVARGLFPHAQVRRIATPVGEQGSYRVNLSQQDEAQLKHPMTWVWVDRWSGQIRAARNSKQLSLGQRFVAALWPLHTAEALGIWGRPLWFCASLAPLLLLATGLVQWLVGRGMLADRAVDFSRWPYFWDQQRPLIKQYGASFAYNLLRAFHWMLGQGWRALRWAKKLRQGA